MNVEARWTIGVFTLLTTTKSRLWAPLAAAATDTHNKSWSFGMKESGSPRVWMKNWSCERALTAGSESCLSPTWPAFIQGTKTKVQVYLRELRLKSAGLIIPRAAPDYNRECRHREQRVFRAMCAPASSLRAALPDKTSNKCALFHLSCRHPKVQSLPFTSFRGGSPNLSCSLALSGVRLAALGATGWLCLVGCSHSLPFISAQWTELGGLDRKMREGGLLTVPLAYWADAKVAGFDCWMMDGWMDGWRGAWE